MGLVPGSEEDTGLIEWHVKQPLRVARVLMASSFAVTAAEAGTDIAILAEASANALAAAYFILFIRLSS
jgi:hypothetical protein